MGGADGDLTLLGRAAGPRGEVLLRRRHTLDGSVEELVVNGVFAMDSSETSSEQELARFALVGAAVAPRVLVGGLGLGYTATAVLDDRLVAAVRVEVVELEAALVDWAQARLTPVLARVADDPRVQLHVADVTEVLHGRVAGLAGPWDAILLDVDNGPDFLIHGENGRLYDEATLRAAYGRLSVGGVLAIWCQGPSTELRRRLRAFGRSREHTYRVTRGSRRFCYVIYVLHRDPDGPAVAGPDGPTSPG